MREFTIVMLICTSLFLVGYDIVAFLIEGPSATISDVLLVASDYAALPFAFGALTGHLFVPQKKHRDGKLKLAGLASLILAALVLVAVEQYIPTFWGRNLLCLLAGGVLGHLVWPQTPQRPY